MVGGAATRRGPSECEDLVAVCEERNIELPMRLTHLGSLGLGWGDTEVVQLAEVLASGAAPRLERLNLLYNEIGDEGCQALAAALKGGAAPSLKARETHPQYKSPWRQPSLTPLTHAYCRGSR